MTKTLGSAWVAVLLAGCLAWCGACSSDDDVSSTSSGDCAITSVVMGALYRDLPVTTATGQDSSYVVTLYGNYYPMSIDQLTRQIYNVDSLPYGTRIDKVRFTTFAADGTLGYRLASGRDTLYTTADSIDFTQPRLFTCYAGDGSGRRTYTVRVNVASLDPTAYSWQRRADAPAIAAWTDARTFVVGDTLYAFGLDNGQLCLLSRLTTGEDDTWTTHALSGTTPTDLQSIVLLEGCFYGLNGTTLCRSTDGHTWQEADANVAPTRLLGAAAGHLYAELNGAVYGSADGQHFTACALDADASLLPQGTPRMAAQPSAANSHVVNALMVGFAGNEQRVWKKEVHLTDAEENPWSYYPITDENHRTLPALSDLSLLPYDGNFYALGLQDGTLTCWISRDGGRTWIKRADKNMVPADMAAQSHAAATVDGQDFIWMVCAGSGQVWRGRLNSLAGKIEQ